MKFIKYLLVSSLVLINCLLPIKNVYSGFGFQWTLPETDTYDTVNSSNTILSFFDLRNREAFIQITNPDSIENLIVHVQIFNVESDCNENNFFDVYTANDTHVYNMRDIQTNDGNPSGVELPENSYGFVAISPVDSVGGEFSTQSIIGNFRVIDDSGYEYRTNSQMLGTSVNTSNSQALLPYTLNFNKSSGVSFSDVVGITVTNFFHDSSGGEVFASNPLEALQALEIDIIDNNEVTFSCRNVIFACVDKDNPRLEDVLEVSGEASVASFEYGINEAIPHSKDGELLCPGNNIPEGFVTLSPLLRPSPFVKFIGFFLYVGLNNGNGRGSMDSIWADNFCADPSPPFLCNN